MNGWALAYPQSCFHELKDHGYLQEVLYASLKQKYILPLYCQVPTASLLLWGFLGELLIRVMLNDIIWEIVVPFS